MEKMMSITAEMGAKKKEVSFPVPEEFVEWMKTVSRDPEDERYFFVRGTANLKIRFRIFDYGHDF